MKNGWSTINNSQLKILFLPNWKIYFLNADNKEIQAPDKVINNQPYWFFRYFKRKCIVDVIDNQLNNPLSFLEKKINSYIWQGIKAFFCASDYDVVISHGAQSGMMYSLLRTVFLHKKPIHIIFDIGGMNGARNNWLENKIIAFCLKSNPHIVCHSKIIIENYKTTYKNLLPRSKFIPFGVDIDDFFPRYKALHESDYVLSFGYAKRDYHTLLQAWGKIMTDKKLRLIGYTNKVLLSNIEILESVTIEELKRQIAGALFVVIPLPVFNYSYGQMSFLQSMSMGKPVVVTSTPSSIDYLKDGEGSFFVKPYDVDDMKLKLQMLLNDKQLIDKAGKRARQYIIDHFSEKLMGENFESYIHSIMRS